jgi:FMN phosphatase YigB (HAD superfamily)
MAVISFDLNGTLLDPRDQRDVLQRAVQFAMAHTLAGEFLPFDELLEAAGGRPPDAMPAYPDVAAGLDRLREAGHELSVLTNSAGDTGTDHLARAGILDRFTRVAGADEAGAYKPDRRVYDLIPDGAWHVAAHWWDILGAGRAGRRTIYIARAGPLPSTVEADIVVERLDEIDASLETA